MTTKNDINFFLARVRQSIKKESFDFINRDKKELTRLGISYKEAIYIVHNLSVENYFRGPSKDHKDTGNLIYEFGVQLEKVELYIKLTYRSIDDLFIMSFHESNRIIKYHYKRVE